jgi:hypothetical protein
MPLHERTKAGLPGRAARLAPRAVRRGGVLVVAAFALAVAGFALVTAPPAKAARPLELGFTSFGDQLFKDPDPSVRNLWLDRASQAGAGIVLLGAGWSNVAPTRPPAGFNPRNPADPAYAWGALDAAVRDATAKGFEVMLLVTRAPPWAEGPDRPDLPVEDLEPGAWKPDPGALGDFATAVATRYAGGFVDPENPGSGALPQVRRWQLWAEPNLGVNLAPQYEAGERTGPELYRRMLASFYTAIKAVAPSNIVVTGGLAPYGDPPGGERTRPLVFYRDLLCLRGRKKLNPTNCPEKPQFDVLAHHPITLRGGPRQSAIHPDDAGSADLGEVRKVLRAAERAQTIEPGGRHPLWATEFWWASRPPVDEEPAPNPRKQARRIEESLYLYWKGGASVAIMLQIRDGDAYFTGGSGLYFMDGTPKPALTAFRFPFVAERLSGARTRAWGRAPVAGKLRIERRSGGGGWQTIKRLNVKREAVFNTRVRVKGRAKLRARVGGDETLVWRLPGA